MAVFVVDTARLVLGYTAGILVIPMTVLIEEYWREISSGLAHHAIPIRHFVLHADQNTLRERIEGDPALGPSPFRLRYLGPCAEAAATPAAALVRTARPLQELVQPGRSNSGGATMTCSTSRRGIIGAT